MNAIIKLIECIPGKPYVLFKCSKCNGVSCSKDERFKYHAINLCKKCTIKEENEKQRILDERQAIKDEKQKIDEKKIILRIKKKLKQAKEEIKERERIRAIFRVPVNPKKCRYHQYKIYKKEH